MNKILVSFLLSLMAIWFLGAVFLTSPTVCHYDGALGLPIPVSGTSKQAREENWNSFRYGEFGLEESDAKRTVASEPKVLIFGDSYIEADMVKPEERVQARLSKMGMQSVGVGISGNSCVEYNHLMGIYNRLIPNVTANVILIADISDILPPNGTTDFQSLKPAYPFRKIEGKFGELSYRFRLMAFRNILKKTITTCDKGLDLQGNNWRKQKYCEKQNDTSHYEDYWRNMLAALKSRAPNGRLMIVYAPIVPTIQNNNISMINCEEETFNRFANLCKSYDLVGGGIIDVSQKLCEYTNRTRRFPRGFFNTRPGEGHLNGDGHRILSEAIWEVLDQ